VPPEAESLRRSSLSTAQDALGQREFASIWATGRSTPLDLVVDQALDAGPDS
jgi:hypothetical protein